MHLNPKKVLPFIVAFVLIAIIVAFIIQQTSVSSTSGIYSGTIEATQIHLASKVGGRVIDVNVKEGARVQVGQVLVDLYSDNGSKQTSSSNEKIVSPINGVVLERLVEPGELAIPNATLITVCNLDELTLTVYVPEDRYGMITLGESVPVTADSFPGQEFNGTVSYIADQAEFTPRNVQTTDSRKSTVYAIKLDLDPSGGLLKPGMPADVHFQTNQ
ncbi:MAG TPA: efflux RND transporter periplasmic adaptor subunit [Anaerolineaceae bacterium]|nr:efflux RND transporter periplasmic adaptor subunit [Anaerolineaceae bacterium]